MNMKIHHIPAAIYAMMAAAGIPGVIAGGSARDALHGLEPKDYDVVVYETGPNRMEVESKLRRLGVEIGQIYQENYEGESSERFDWCVKAKFLGRDVDFIGLQIPCSNPLEVVESFDFDINQAWFDDAGYVRAHECYPVMGEEISVLQLAELHPERTKKLAAKFPQYDWANALKLTENKQ